MPIRKGSKGTKEEGGASGPSGDGGKVHYPKNQGTADESSGGVPSVQTSRKGLNLETKGHK